MVYIEMTVYADGSSPESHEFDTVEEGVDSVEEKIQQALRPYFEWERGITDAETD